MNEGRENQPLEVIGKFRRRRFAPKESWVAVHYIYIVYVRPPFAQIISKRRFAPKDSGVVVLYIYSLRTSTYDRNQCTTMKESGVVVIYIYSPRMSKINVLQ